jgi:Domain of unknown function (DUF4844)
MDAPPCRGSAEEKPMIKATAIAKLQELRARPKFKEEPGTLYNGMRPENDRQAAEAQLNDLIDQLIQDFPDPSEKEGVLLAFAQTLDCFPGKDSENQERLCSYIEEIMDMVGIESSGGLLNLWRYGFDPMDVDLPPRGEHGEDDS